MADETADCLFCRVVAGDMPADVVHRGDRVLAFRDIDPQAPTHVLVIPREHHPDVGALAAADPAALAGWSRLPSVAARRGARRLPAGVQHRCRAGQTVFHVHGHVLGGRAMTWPPG